MDENPKPRRRSAVTESVNRSSENSRSETNARQDDRVERDVLMENPAPRYSAGDMPVARPEPAARRERGYTKASPQGKKNRVNDANNTGTGLKLAFAWNFSWLNRRFTAVVMVIFLSIAIYWASEPIAKVFERPIKSVVVEGEFHLISKQRATELIGDEINGDFLQLDLMELKAALLSDPWVEKVTLNRISGKNY